MGFSLVEHFPPGGFDHANPINQAIPGYAGVLFLSKPNPHGLLTRPSKFFLRLDREATRSGT